MRRLRYWCALIAVLASFAGMRSMAFPDDNFPLYRGYTGEADAIALGASEYAYDYFDGPGVGAVVTASALIIPDWDATVTTAQMNSSVAGIGNHANGGATTNSGYQIMANTQNDAYGSVEGIIVTYANGSGSAAAWLGADTNMFAVVEGPGGVVVTFNGTPISVTAGGGAPLELILPATPGMNLNLATATQVLAANNSDQGDASVEASVYPVESLPLPAAVFRDAEGNIEESWVFDPPPPPPRDG